jgi:hypothetical protein
MIAGEDWSLDEVEAAMSDYFEMLTAELAGSSQTRRKETACFASA